MLRRKYRYKIFSTRHLKQQVDKRFKRRFGLTDAWIEKQVREALSRGPIAPYGVYWVRLAVLSEEIKFVANTKDGAVNGDTLYAVVRWSERREVFNITTILLRRGGQSLQCDKLFDAPALTHIDI